MDRAKVHPTAPYEVVAHEVRQQILAGDLVADEPVPSTKQLATRHGVSVGSAHRALALLRKWGLISDTARGRRSVVLEPTNERTPAQSPATSDESQLVHIHLLHFGSEVRSFTTEVDASSTKQLRRLITTAARRHGGVEANLDEYEIEMRAANHALLTTFAL